MMFRSCRSEMMPLPLAAMMRCLPSLMSRRTHHANFAHHGRRLHHLPVRANIMQKPLLLFAKGEYDYICSTYVRGCIAYGFPLDGAVPPAAIEIIKRIKG